VTSATTAGRVSTRHLPGNGALLADPTGEDMDHVSFLSTLPAEDKAALTRTSGPD